MRPAGVYYSYGPRPTAHHARHVLAVFAMFVVVRPGYGHLGSQVRLGEQMHGMHCVPAAAHGCTLPGLVRMASCTVERKVHMDRSVRRLRRRRDSPACAARAAAS